MTVPRSLGERGPAHHVIVATVRATPSFSHVPNPRGVFTRRRDPLAAISCPPGRAQSLKQLPTSQDYAMPAALQQSNDHISGSHSKKGPPLPVPLQFEPIKEQSKSPQRRNGCVRTRSPSSNKLAATRRQSFTFDLFLPLSFLAFFCLHIGFRIAKHSSRLWTRIRSARTEERLVIRPDISSLLVLGNSRRQNAEPKDSKVNLPKHIAITFIPPTPNTLVLTWRYFAKLSQSALASGKGFSGMQECRAAQGSATESARRAMPSSGTDNQQLKTLQRLLLYAALAGTRDVSVWDTDTALEQLIAGEMATDGANCETHWELGILQGGRQVVAEVSFAEETRPKQQSNVRSKLHEGNRTPDIVSIRLDLLSPRSKGRRSFAALPRLLASELLSPQAAAALTPSKVDEHLRRLGLIASAGEPDLLIVWGGHWSSHCSIADYCRWDLRLTEIVNVSGFDGQCRPYSERFTFDDETESSCLDLRAFAAALRQFGRAEQRFGK